MGQGLVAGYIPSPEPDFPVDWAAGAAGIRSAGKNGNHNNDQSEHGAESEQFCMQVKLEVVSKKVLNGGMGVLQR